MVATLAVDAQTVRVVMQLRATGVDPILLKGPSIAAWLYDAPAERAYVDTDLLIDESNAEEAARVLTSLGYREPPSLPTLPTPSTTWVNAVNGLEVDLHKSIWAWGAGGGIWDLLQKHTRPLRVGALEIRVLDEVAQCVHVVTHAVQDALQGEKANEDLRRALEKEPDEVWTRAARLAMDAGAVEAFALGLHSQTAGVALCGRLGIEMPQRLDPQILNIMAGTTSGVAALEALRRAGGARARAAVLRDQLFPPVEYARSKLPEVDAKSHGSVWTYGQYWLWLLAKAPGALKAWYAVWRESNR